MIAEIVGDAMPKKNIFIECKHPDCFLEVTEGERTLSGYCLMHSNYRKMGNPTITQDDVSSSEVDRDKGGVNGSKIGQYCGNKAKST